VKQRHEGRFVVVGLDVPLAGACALLLAARIGRRLMYVGRCEWGATRAVVARIRERCTTLSGPACEGVERVRSIVWVHPDVVAEVSYAELMQGRLRDAVLSRVASTGGGVRELQSTYASGSADTTRCASTARTGRVSRSSLLRSTT
jgi:ATP-dependent DNA ligase